ncbi:hypothetical protein V6N12_045604 [Hibiscus sabdariffa]|uniref:Uncharacterized protein n=1 Tax=Hibiscus sabdariffa TaxID=183260 RepID=A0ABR2G3U5_9ROSI
MTVNEECSIYHHGSEDINQVLRDCPKDSPVWQQLVPLGKLVGFHSSEIQQEMVMEKSGRPEMELQRVLVAGGESIKPNWSVSKGASR